MQLRATYPSREHGEAAEAIIDFFITKYQIEVVLLVNSCARGKATRDSCLDIVVLARPEILQSELSNWEKQWGAFNQTNPIIQALKTVGKYSVVHLDFSNGVFEPKEQDEAAGPDSFELGVGNYLTYSVPLWQRSDYLAQLKQQWLPYYNESLRQQRLQRVRFYCLNNLHHIPCWVIDLPIFSSRSIVNPYWFFSSASLRRISTACHSPSLKTGKNVSAWTAARTRVR